MFEEISRWGKCSSAKIGKLCVCVCVCKSGGKSKIKSSLKTVVLLKANPTFDGRTLGNASDDWANDSAPPILWDIQHKKQGNITNWECVTDLIIFIKKAVWKKTWNIFRNVFFWVLVCGDMKNQWPVIWQKDLLVWIKSTCCTKQSNNWCQITPERF